MGKITDSELYRSGATEDQRTNLRKEFKSFAEKLSKLHSLSPEAIVLEMRYWHQSASNEYRTNASEKDKSTSLEHHKGKCQYPSCSKSKLTKKTAVFHHDQRAVSEQHSPANLLPYCMKCHDKVHGNENGSLHRGSPKSKK